MTTIREATVDDVPALVAMGQRFIRGSVYATRLRENVAQMAVAAERLIASEDGMVLVLDAVSDLVGMIGLVFFEHHLSGEATAGEVFFWVDPEYRGRGLRLMRHAEQWARDKGATTIQMIAPTPDVGRLYERLGYAELEVSYGKELR